MKKYTILDHRGKKTIVYAKDIAHALPYAKDSRKIKDRMSLSEINEAIDDIADKYDGFYSRTYDKVFKDLKAKYPSLTYEEVKQVIEMYADNPSSANAQLRVAKKYFSDSIDDSKVKDVDFNIVDKLIAEEEKAVMDYKEALTADSDSFANSVYTHILDEELEHLRELRSLKEQSASDENVAEKKLDDSIHDGLSEAKDLVEQAGFKVVRVYGTDNEPYITVDWSGSYSELQKKVRELKSKAAAIGYKSVYADDNDICFSKY